MADEDNELNYIAIGFYNGIAIGFGWFKYPHLNRAEFKVYIPFIQVAWVKQMVNDEEADDIINNNFE